MDPTQLAWLISLVPNRYKVLLGALLISLSFLLNLASYLRRKIQPPPAGSRWTKPYAVLTELAGAKDWAAPMYDVGQSAVKTSRSEAARLKVVAVENRIPLLDRNGKPKPPDRPDTP